MNFSKNVLYAIIIAIMGCMLCISRCNKRVVAPPARKVTPAADIRKAAQSEIRKYEDKLDSLQESNNILQQQSALLSTQLEEARRRNKRLQQAATLNIERVNEAIDTAEKLMACDSLQYTVEEMMVASNYKDSLYESAIGTFKATITNKDSCVEVYRQQQSVFSHALDRCLSDHKQLYEENNAYRRQARSQNVQNKVLTAGIVFIAGVATYSFIKH